MATKLSLTEDFGNDLKKRHGLKVFDYTLVVAITNGFSSENKLITGRFWTDLQGDRNHSIYTFNQN